MGLSKGKYFGVVAIQIASDSSELACKWGKSQAKGTPQVTVLCEVESGPKIGDQMEWVGYIAGGATEGTLRNLRALGFEGDDLDTFADQRPTKPFMFEVDDEEYKGKVRQKIVRIGADTTMTPGELRKLSNEMRPKLAQFKSDSGHPLGDDEPAF